MHVRARCDVEDGYFKAYLPRRFGEKWPNGLADRQLLTCANYSKPLMMARASLERLLTKAGQGRYFGTRLEMHPDGPAPAS